MSNDYTSVPLKADVQFEVYPHGTVERTPHGGRWTGKMAAGALLDGREHREFPK